MSTGVTKKKKAYELPKTILLNKGNGTSRGANELELRDTALRLENILSNFGITAEVVDYSRGPSVTRYEIQPEIGTRLANITKLSDDIKLHLAATDIRIEPIPGKSTIGIEVPNEGRDAVLIRELIESAELKNHPSKLAFAAGKDIAGQVIVGDIAKMPHMLVAGTTGSGKSVFTNSIIMSILFRATPDEVRLIIVDPKVVEFGVYNGIPHLLQPVVTDPKLASSTLKWAVAEMSDRYKKFAEYNVRDLKGYNEKIVGMAGPDGELLKKLPQIVIVIDELADLMMVAAKEVEESICRLAQLARAAGIHLIIATQRPSVNVVTGLIKANVPSRVALMVSSGVDSRTIIDQNGAEKLLGNGDMLFYPSGYVKPVRLQGAFVSDGEVQKVVDFWKAQATGEMYDNSISQYVESQASQASGNGASLAMTEDDGDGRDEYFYEAAKFVIEKDKASTSMLQRVFKIGFNRAARIMDQMCEAGVIGEEEGTKPRKVLMTLEDLDNL
jgi:S-DNA-T family DNA segregation ATPase FtsK/SpoIIIE